MRKILLLISVLLALPFASFAQEDTVELSCESATIEEAVIGNIFVVSCPADCGDGSLWGTDIYTADSNICTAAVHAGVIDIEEGGEFSIYYIDGQDEYSESEQNGIESSDWGSYGMSFAFEPIAIEIEWTTRARDLQGEIGDSFDVLCPEDGEASSLWGTEIYTDDSSVCTAAVHMGLIDFEDGGAITMTLLEGEEEYIGSEENDIESSDWGTWSVSFSVSLTGEVIEVEWTTRARDLEGEIGDTFEVLCPEDGEASSLWGTEIYTDDSSICTAAVHMGLIDFEDGGQITVTLLEGEKEYTGSEENDIESSNWGAWSVSFSVSESDAADTEESDQ